MEGTSFIVMIVLIACSAGVANNYIKSRAKLAAKNASERRDDEEIDELRQRIEVLEKIVTDSRYQLENQINDLEHRA